MDLSRLEDCVMQHGPYIAEFEKTLFKKSFAISHGSLSELIREVDFSKLRVASEQDRFAFYEALVDSIDQRSRGNENGIQILGEDDSRDIVEAMKGKAANQQFASMRIRELWCLIFIGGCP
jgi:hypothetical protein